MSENQISVKKRKAVLLEQFKPTLSKSNKKKVNLVAWSIVKFDIVKERKQQ